MNPLVLLALGLGAAMVLGRKRGNGAGNGDGNGNGAGNGDGTPDTDDLPDPDTDTGPGAGTQVPPELLAYFSDPGDPRSGTFYPVTRVDIIDPEGEPYPDPIKGIANQVLFGQRVYAAGTAVTFGRCINGAPWNVWLFDDEKDSSLQTADDGAYAAKAFDPINADAIADMFQYHRWPRVAERGTTIEDGKMKPGAAGSLLGLLWLPPSEVHRPDIGMSTLKCPVGQWAEGGSTKNPPESILKTLTGPRPDWRPAPPRPEGGVQK